MNCGVQPYLFTPLPVIIVLDIRYPQLGRCLGGEIHLIFWALRIVVSFNLPRLRSHVALSRFCLVGQHERKGVIHAPALFVFWGMLFGKFWLPLKCDLRNSTNQSWFDPRNRTCNLKGLTFKELLQWELLTSVLFVFVSSCNICSKEVQQRVVNWTYLFDLLPPASAIAGWKMDHECMNLTPPSHFGVLSVVMNRPLPVVGLPMIIAYKWYVLYCSLLAIPD